MLRAPRRLAFLAALAAALGPALPASAGTQMSSANNAIARDVDDGGGTYSASGAGATNNQMTGSAAEEVVVATATSANYRLRAGYSTIASYPGTITALTVRSDIGSSSMTFNWATPGYDGGLGTAPSGSAYLVQIASAAFVGIFNGLTTVSVTISTQGTSIGTVVGSAATALDANTTFFATVELRDNDGDVGGPFTTTFATAPTLALPPSTAGTLEFTSIQGSSVTVAWVAPFETAITSKTNEGYIVQGSSDNFGAIVLPTPAPVFSSSTVNIGASVALSTLTLKAAPAAPGAVLDLGNTYYFQVASLNWAGKPNYTTLNKLNFQIIQSTGLVSFTLNPSVARSTVSTSSMVVTNVGTWPATIQLTASTATAGGSPWGLGTSPGIETAVLMGQWYPGVGGPPSNGPPASSFTTFLDTTSYISQTGAGNYVGYQSLENGVQLPPGSKITLWLYFTLPSSSVSLGPEAIVVGSQPLYP
jgi:hypothetical protein